jgi:hypothetical protein
MAKPGFTKRFRTPVFHDFIWLAAVFAIATGCESGPAPQERPAPAPAVVASTPHIEVGEHGFQPTRIVVGTDHRLVFRRTSDATCATAVVFPSLGLERALPLGTDVAIDLPPSARGELGFQCGMGMYKSKVVVQ